MTRAWRATVGLGALAAVIGCGQGAPDAGTSDPTAGELRPAPGRPVYEGSAAVDPHAGIVEAEWTIRFVVDSTLVHGASVLLAEGLDVTALEGDNVAGYTEAGWREGSGVRRIAVDWSAPAAPGEVREIRLAYEGAPFDSLPEDPINSMTPEWIELGLDSFWHPVFESFDQDIVGELRLSVPADWTVVASGEVTREGELHVLRSTVPQVDVAFVGAPVLERTAVENVAVYHEGADPRTVARVIETATVCKDWLTGRFGPMPALKFVLAPRDDGGYARKNYVVLTRVDDFPDPVLSRFICHELAHYWSSAASSSSPDYWMTEAFAELVAARHVRDVHGDSAYAPIVEQWRSQAAGRPPVWTDTATQRGSFAINYRKGPLLLTRLEEQIGSEPFAELLRRYMTESTATTRRLLEQLEEVAGPEASAAFREMLAADS